MGIYIPNMEMPTQCGNCPMSTNTRRCTILWREFGDLSKRLEDCPLVPLPAEHGRLIDADAFCKQIANDRRIGGIVAAGMISYIEHAPTIVPAEGGGEDG